MYGFAGITPAEDRRRLSTFLYYIGVKLVAATPAQFEKLSPEQKFYFTNLLGRGRVDQSLSNNWKPVGLDEYKFAQDSYSNFSASFDRKNAAEPVLGFVLTAADRPVDLTNLDRWYERDQGERIGEYILYRVRLRP